MYWHVEYRPPGPTAPTFIEIKLEKNDVVTLTDDIYKAEHFELKLDGQPLGETHEDEFEHSANRGYDAEKCMERGWPDGEFLIPKGKLDPPGHIT